MNHYGIWIDLKTAIIVRVSMQRSEIVEKVGLSFSLGHVKGGARSSTPYGPQDAVSESKVLEKRKHELADFFSKITHLLKDPKAVLIAGPSQVKNELRDYMLKSYDFRDVGIRIRTADSMTDNQVKALFRDYFLADQNTLS